ncbi:MAG: proline dehydrogenase family protein, partial [Mycetocola sp.]
MVQPSDSTDQNYALLTEQSFVRVARWIESAAAAEGQSSGQSAAEQLSTVVAQLVTDQESGSFVRLLATDVLRPVNASVAGQGASRAARNAPSGLSGVARAALAVGGQLGPVMPRVAVPAVRRSIRHAAASLVSSDDADAVGELIQTTQAQDMRVGVRVLAGPVIGDIAAGVVLERLRVLASRDDLEVLSIDPAALLPHLTPWSAQGASDELVARLVPVLTAAAASGVRLMFDAGLYRNHDAVVRSLLRIIDAERWNRVSIGITLSAAIPESFTDLQLVVEHAQRRYDSGGAPIVVRLVKGGNLPAERVDAELGSWPLAVTENKKETDTNLKRMLHWALSRGRTEWASVTLASHNLYDVAYARAIAEAHGVVGKLEFEFRRGLAGPALAAVNSELGPVRIDTPLLADGDAVALGSFLTTLASEYSSGAFPALRLGRPDSAIALQHERDAFRSSVVSLEAEPHRVPDPLRTQNRETEWTVGAPVPVEWGPDDSLTREPESEDSPLSLTQKVLGLAGVPREPESPFDTVRVFDSTTLPQKPLSDLGAPGFVNVPDTDPALAANRAWMDRLLRRAELSETGKDAVRAAVVDDDEVDGLVAVVRSRAEEWGARPAERRADVVLRAGLSLAANRDRLLDVLVAEVATTVTEADHEVSEAIDLAGYYAAKTRELDAVRGARFVAPRLCVARPGADRPVADAAGSALAALAVGAGVILVPDAGTQRCVAVVAEALWEAGFPRDLLVVAVPGTDGDPESDDVVGHVADDADIIP